ncbi:hypothetical protein [Pedobacter sp. ASV28]|jgi:hypothetical protein|uniref:hypothetical protein n=1 Tax=Pedobacter sp. ASV28 TaxID=2795123 RepID=UPI0018ED682F|nr:hypothetical protein [Pedobacter sp. ASV28]
MWYKLDLNKLVVLLVPTFLRRPLFISWLQSLVAPLVSVQQSWYVKRLDNLYKLDHNGQICYLRKALNDAFDPSLRRIYITDGNKYTRAYIYTNGEQQTKYLGKMHLRQVDDYADTGVDFRVIMPSDFSLPSNIYQLRALIDFYKLASKRYLIELQQ